MSDDDCPCGRGAAYADCCEPYHRGAEPKDAETLMRARFCAFVELSSFVHDGTGWRYLLGAPLLVSRLSGDPQRLRIASFPDAVQGSQRQKGPS